MIIKREPPPAPQFLLRMPYFVLWALEKNTIMNVKAVGSINDDGTTSPVMTDEEERQMFEDCPWLREEDFEHCPVSQLVIEITAESF